MRVSITYEPMEVARFLEGKGYKVKDVMPIEMEVDGVVELNEEVHIQVGEGYMIVVHRHEDGFVFGDEVDSLVTLEKELKKVLDTYEVCL